VSLALLPTSFKALRTRARIYLYLEKYDNAIADFKAAIEQVGMESSNADVRALGGELKAEAALKRSKTKNYYKILGTSVFFFAATSLAHLNRLSLWVGGQA
jgi:DnaJ family protein C protein 7